MIVYTESREQAERGWAHSKHYDTEPPPPSPHIRGNVTRSSRGAAAGGSYGGAGRKEGGSSLGHGEGEEDEGEEAANSKEDDLRDNARLDLVVDKALDDRLWVVRGVRRSLPSWELSCECHGVGCGGVVPLLGAKL